MTIRALKAELLHSLDQSDVRIILHLATGLDALSQITESERKVTEEEEMRARDLAGKRCNGTPIAYLSGIKEFYGLEFHVNESVLIPRPDTETLVDVAIELSKAYEEPKILDLCTGSGAIATALSCTLSLPVFASDISPDALSVAKENYQRLTGRIPDFRLGSLFKPWSGEQFDLIVSNPPYLTDLWYEETAIDVKKEPKLAFIGGGEDGLDLIKTIIEESIMFLNDNGAIAIECDYRQAASCARILEYLGFSHVGITRDATGKERVVHGRRLSK